MPRKLQIKIFLVAYLHEASQFSIFFTHLLNYGCNDRKKYEINQTEFDEEMTEMKKIQNASEVSI